MFKKLLEKLNDGESQLMEFVRYGIVGGISTVTDWAVLFVTQELIFAGTGVSLYIPVALGFLCGLLVNYLLSISFVFASAKGTKVGRTGKDVIVFLIIGATGLALTELGMHLGTTLTTLNYMIVKVIVTVIVLMWNFFARKYLIFDRKPKKD